MKKKKLLTRIVGFTMAILLLFSSFALLWTNDLSIKAAPTTNVKKKVIHMVMDNSQSMFINNGEGSKKWCQVKYAMEVFASMMDFKNGDVLKIYPMHGVSIGGEKIPKGENGGFVSVENTEDIQKIRNIYTDADCYGTPFDTVETAYKELIKADTNSDRWLVVLTDGDFTEKNKDGKKNVNGNIIVEPIEEGKYTRLKEMSNTGIKVENFEIRGKKDISGKGNKSGGEEKEKYPNYNEIVGYDNSEGIIEGLITACNQIFNRDVITEKYISGNTINFDVSMRKIIIFAQGDNVEVNSFGGKTAVSKQEIKYSELSSAWKPKADDDFKFPSDTSLKGVVATFEDVEDFEAGIYELDSNIDISKCLICYEAAVDIKISLTKSDDPEKKEIEFPVESLEEGEYIVNIKLIDENTGKPVTSELLGNIEVDKDSTFNIGSNKQKIKDGSKISIKADGDEAGSFDVKVIYGNKVKYTLSTDGKTNLKEIKIEGPADSLVINATVKQPKSWYRLKDHDSWQPIRVDLKSNGELLTDEQLSTVGFEIETDKEISYRYELIKGESAINIYIGQDDKGNYVKPNKNKYKLQVKAIYINQYDKESVANDSVGFTVQSYSVEWRWIRWILGILAFIALVLFVATRPAWPKSIYLMIQNTQNEIESSKDTNLASARYPGLLPCTAKKNSSLWRCRSKKASIKIIEVTPGYDVVSYTIGDGASYRKSPNGVFKDSAGCEFTPTTVRNQTLVKVKRRDGRIVSGRIKMNG